MSTIVVNGSPNAKIHLLIIQEFDLNHNLIFEWNAWDHLNITDYTNLDLTANNITWMHGNSIDVDLDENILDFIVDDNPLKQGLYTPISHIPILSADALYTLCPDYVLVLAWNFAEPIIKAHQMYSQKIGKFILPMPVPQIVE